MSKPFEILLKNAESFAKFLINYFIEIIQRLVKEGRGIHPKDRVKDALAVLGSTSMLLFLNLLALVIFIFLPQGKDVIYIISEDVGVAYQVSSLLWLLGGLVCWSYISEFASRYAIYVSDNSGAGLSGNRVKWRKECQRALSSIFLIMPYFIVLISLLVNYIQDNTLLPMQAKIGFGVPALLIYLLLNLTVYVYFSDPDKVKSPVIKYFIKAKKLPPSERKWAERLYGMYNDFVFTIRKPDNFKDQPRNLLSDYIHHITSHHIKIGFPQNKDLIEENSVVPEEFQLKNFTIEREKPNGHFRWIYYIPNSFYKTIHNQLRFIVIVCLVLFLIITFLPVNAYQHVGTPALLILSFSCWIGLYIGVLFIDYGIFRPRYKFITPEAVIYESLVGNKPISKTNNVSEDKCSTPSKYSFILSRISLRFILFVLLIFCSFINNDHPLRYNTNGACCTDNRPPLKVHFANWFKNYCADPKSQYLLKDSVTIDTMRYQIVEKTTGNDTIKHTHDTLVIHSENKKFYPVVFVCAEGGAMRTGAFTAMLLSYIEDSLMRRKNCQVDFQKSIYAFSAVSGGSVGVSFFNAEAILNSRNDLLVKDSLINRTMFFFSHDFLAPVIGKMFYGDVLNLFLPSRIEQFDRAIALEKGWENAYQEVINSTGQNYFSSSYMQTYSRNHAYPALFINTTEVETGLQCWLANVKPDTSMFDAANRDLFNHKIRGGINYSTMINFSSRFPMFSPAAEIFQNDNQKYHYVDGGYVENTGSATMVEILNVLAPMWKDTSNHLIPKGCQIIPYVIQIRFSDGLDKFKNINFGNEVTEILNGIYNTRAGRVSTATNDLSKLVHSLNGKFIPLSLTVNNSKVPMNWVLSDKCVANVLTSIKQQYGKKDMQDLFSI